MMSSNNFNWFREIAAAFEESEFALVTPNVGYLLAEASRHSPHGIGGDSHRHWVAGVFADGVYLYVDNHTVGVSCTESPNATLTRGCQESRAHGHPWPTPSEGIWIPLRHMPEVAVPKIEETLSWLKAHIVEVVRQLADEWEKRAREEEQKRLNRRAEIELAWGGGVSGNL